MKRKFVLFGERGEVETYSAIDQEAFESSNSGTHERLQLVLIAGDDAAVEADVDPTLALSCGDFLFQAGQSGCWRNGIERHVDNGRHSTKSGGSGSGPEAFPFGSAGFVQVYMSVDEAGKKDLWRMVYIGCPRRKVFSWQYGMEYRSDFACVG